MSEAQRRRLDEFRALLEKLRADGSSALDAMREDVDVIAEPADTARI